MTRTGKILSLAAAICALPAGLIHAKSFGTVQAVQFTTSFPFTSLARSCRPGRTRCAS